MATRTEDLTVVQGTDATFKINIKDSAGNAFDITDKSFSASMKKSFSALTVLRLILLLRL